MNSENNQTNNIQDTNNQNIPLQNNSLPEVIPNIDANPQNNQSITTGIQNNLIELESKDNELKTDGVVIIGNVINEDEMIAIPSAKIPAAIDIKERKKEQQKNKDSKKKTYKVNKEAAPKQKGQSIVAIGAFLVIVLLVASFIIINNSQKKDEFNLNNITIEYMEETYPKKVSKYVQTKENEIIDELQYTLDLSEVGEEIGVYNNKVTYKGITKTGTIEIVDRKKPDLTVRPVAIISGESYSAYQFSSSCYDHSGCNIFFEDSSIENKYSKPGTYEQIQISAVDAYNNKTTKETSLTILEKPYIYEKTDYSEDLTYTLTTTYTLYFHTITIQGSTISNIFCSDTVCNDKKEVYTYSDSTLFQAEKQKHYGEIGYEINDFKQTITYNEQVRDIGPYKYNDKDKVLNYLETNNYIQK